MFINHGKRNFCVAPSSLLGRICAPFLAVSDAEDESEPRSEKKRSCRDWYIWDRVAVRAAPGIAPVPAVAASAGIEPGVPREVPAEIRALAPVADIVEAIVPEAAVGRAE